MDVLNRTFNENHMTVLSRCVDPHDEPVLVGRWAEGYLLLTHRRLVVTRQSRLLHRMRLHLNADVRHLSNVHLTVEDRGRTLAVNLTAMDGVRERFCLKLPADRVRRAEELFRTVLTDRTEAAVA
jgi:hypothetical protein